MPDVRRLPGGLPSLLCLVEGWYYVATGTWPVVSPELFQRVTGPKQDFWLAVTVGLLLAVIGMVLLLARRRRAITCEIAYLGCGTALLLAVVDVHCTNLPRTTEAYLLDAAAELVLAIGWGVALRRHHRLFTWK